VSYKESQSLELRFRALLGEEPEVEMTVL
jgi:hypothetical protein